MIQKSFFAIIFFALVFGCTENQREGWEKRFESALGEPAQEAKAGTLNANNFAMANDKQEMIGLETTLADFRQIDDVLELPSELQANPNSIVSISAPLRGRISVLNVSLGSPVEQNAVVAVIENPENLGQKLPIRAPIRGVVSKRPANAGEWVEEGANLLEITDYTTLVGVIRIYEDELGKVAPGQEVVFTCNGLTAKGQISYISSALDPDTRTAEARAIVSNPGGRLKANAYASAQITISRKNALVISKSALLPEDTEFIVFVQAGERFEKRLVEIGIQQNGLVEISSGLSVGERVVSKGAFQLKNINFSSAAGEEDEE